MDKYSRHETVVELEVVCTNTTQPYGKKFEEGFEQKHPEIASVIEQVLDLDYRHNPDSMSRFFEVSVTFTPGENELQFALHGKEYFPVMGRVASRPILENLTVSISDMNCYSVADQAPRKMMGMSA